MYNIINLCGASKIDVLYNAMIFLIDKINN